MVPGKKYLHNDPAILDRRRELRQRQTDAERAFWSQVRSHQFHSLKFFRQFSVGPYILDFYCPVLKLAIELDGGQHNLLENREYDAIRSDFLKSQGIQVMRFWNHEVLLEMRGVLEKIEEYVDLSLSLS